MTVELIEKREYESHLDIKNFIGINSYGEHSELKSGELRECENFHILSNGHLESRKGSQYLKKTSNPTKRGSTSIVNSVTWDIGSEEYLITQEGTSFYSQALLVVGDPTLILDFSGASFVLSSSDQCEMFLNGDKLFIFHSGGNKIIEWNGSAFTGRTMGIVKPKLLAVTSLDTGLLTGKYTWGIEKVYQVSGTDKVASTPNRKYTTRIINNIDAIVLKKPKITIESTDLDNDSLWTHIRLWRSKNQNTNFDDVSNPIDPVGLPSELYEVALITKAEMQVGSLTAIATGDPLPIGNSNVTAGSPTSVYTITDNCKDEELGELVGIDRIELSPLPPANTGIFHRGKIYVADVNSSQLDDDSGDNIYYSNWAGTKYSEQYDPLQIIKTGRHGQKILKLISFEKDLIALKEGKTGRLPDGDSSIPFEILDHRMGIKHKNMAEYIPGIGICGITTDNGDFRIFGFDYLWRNNINGIEVSRQLRTHTSALTGATVSMVYLNGKILISDGLSNVWCLSVEQKRGWTKYTYPTNSLSERLFAFANESRGGIASKDTHLVEIDVDIDTDINVSTDQADTIKPFFITHKYSVEEGSHLIEFDKYTIMGRIKYEMQAIPFLNGVTWPLKTSDTETTFVVSPSIDYANVELRDKEYSLYLKPATIGGYLSQVPVGNFLHFKIKSTAPVTIKTNKLWVTVDEDPGWGDFDPFQTHGLNKSAPSWAADFIQEASGNTDIVQEAVANTDTVQEGL